MSDSYNSRIRLLALTPAPSILTQTGLTGTNSLNVSLSVTGLVANTTYYYRALATNSLGTVAGQTLSFTTPGQDTTVELASNLNPAPYGSNVTFTATVSTSAATGTVSFLDGTNTLGMVTLSGGVATFTTNGLTAGSHSITAAYSGDASYGASPSSALNQTVNQAAAIVDLGSLAQTYTGSAISVTATTTPAGLPVSFTYNGSASAPVDAGSYTVIGTVSDASYAGSSTNTLVISRAAAPVALGSLAQTYTGSARGATATTTPAGVQVNFAYNGSATPPVNAGSYTVIGTVANPNYVGSATNTLVVNPAAAVVTLGGLSQTYNGSARSVTVGTIPAGLPVGVTYDGAAPAPVNGGSYAVIAVVINPNYSGGATSTLVVSPASQTINLALEVTNSIPLNQFTNPITVTAVASSGLPVTLTLDTSSVATLTETNTLVNVGQTGTITLRANQPGNANYAAAAETVVLLDVTKASQAISFGALADQVATNAPFALAATADSGLPVAYTVVSGPATLSSNVLTLTGAGIVTVAADQPGEANYNAAATVSRSLNVTLAAQSITFGSLPDQSYAAAPITLAATASSGLPVSYVSSDAGVASISGSTVSIVGVGLATVTASQSGNAFYDAAVNVSQTLTVTQATPVVAAWPTASAITYGQSLASSTLGGGSAAVAGTFAWTTPGTKPSAGTDSQSITFMPNDTTNYVSVSGSVSVTVNRTSLAVVLDTNRLSQAYDGTAKSVTVLSPTNLVVNLTYAGSADAPTNAGSYTVVATIADVNCTGSTTNVLVINQATPGVTTWPTAGAITYGQTLASSTLSGGSAGVDGTFAWATPGTTPTAGTAPQSVTFTPGDAANFVSVSGSASVTVNQAALAVVLDANSLSQTYDGTAKNVIVLSPANLLVDISYDRNPHAPAAAGSYPVVATISDANYTGSATNTLVINQALAMVTLDNLNQTYDGTGKAVTVTTDPTNLAVNVTYDGSVNAPTNVASYTVIGTITDPNYIGSATNTLAVDDVVVVCFPVQNGLWSDPATWQGGVVPPDGSDVFIPADLSVTVDVATSALGNVTVAGTLSLGSNLLTVSGNYINNGTVNPGTGTVVLVGSSNQVLAATAPGTLTFYKLTVNKTPATATVTATSKLKATKKLTITSGKLISASDYGDVLIENAGAIELTSDITIAGDLVIQGGATLTTFSNKITFDGGIEQNLTLDNLVQFYDLTVTAGTTLIETGSGDNVLVNGTLLNQGVIRKTQGVAGVDSYYFGLAGDSGAGLEIDVTSLAGADPLTAIQVDRVDSNAPNAPGTNVTGIYWTIAATGSDFTATVIVPQDGLADPQVCRYRNSAWDWARSAFDATTVTRTNLAAFGVFAVFEKPQVAIVPAPEVQAVSKDGGNITFGWTAQSGQTYQVSYATNLAPPVIWTDLGSPVTATNTVMTTTQAAAASEAARFYRVRVVVP